MLRSADDWSAGISGTELSIQNAYIDLIQKAENYIYIEVNNSKSNKFTNIDK
jgi:hypothetical protein